MASQLASLDAAAPTTDPARVTSHAAPLDIELVDANGGDMRRVAVDARADTALASSIRRRGVLQPIGVRPAPGGRYQDAFGRRRLRCAAAAGLTWIPAMVRDWTDDELRAVQAVENMQRQAPHAIDTWCTVCDLVDAGYSIPEAADELGLSDQATRQMERLGRLDPALLKLIEIEMPPDHQLRAIANATPKVQRAALKGLGSRAEVRFGDGRRVAWHEIAQLCRVERISRTKAIFDTAAHPTMWTEDMFAQPDDPERFTTTDIAKFLKLQRAALQARIEKQRAEKLRIELAEFDGQRYTAAIPSGWRLVTVAPGRAKPKRTECIFAAVAPDGRIVEALALNVAADKEAQKKRREADKKKAAQAPAAARQYQPAEDGEFDSADTETDNDTPEPPADTGPGITKAGLDILARAKTEALRAALRIVAGSDVSFDVNAAHTLLCLFVLALSGDNIEIRPYGTRARLRGLAARLIGPGGIPIALGHTAIRELAGEALAAIVLCGGPGSAYRAASGDAAEWIGTVTDAASHLPRLDTPEFLKEVKGETLRTAAASAGKSAKGSVSELRAALGGAMPDWRPAAAAFGAAAPMGDDEDLAA